MSSDVGEVTESLENEQSSCSFSMLSIALPTSYLILQPFRRFTYVTAHSPTLPLLHLRHSPFSNPSIPSPTSQLMSRAHSPTFPSLHLRHSSFSNTSVPLPTSQLISRVHSPTFQSLHLRHNPFSNPSDALPTSQFILQPFRCFTYVTAHSPTLLSLLLRHRLFT